MNCGGDCFRDMLKHKQKKKQQTKILQISSNFLQSHRSRFDTQALVMEKQLVVLTLGFSRL